MLRYKIIYFVTILAGLSACNNSINCSVDLTELKNDQVQVRIEIPEIDQDTLIFAFPRILPGHYTLVNYGRFVENLQAVDRQSNPIEVDRLDENNWQIISRGNKIGISYTLNDTQDAQTDLPVMPWSATDFKKDSLFVLNNGGVFGYLNGHTDLSYIIDLEYPEHLFPAGSLQEIENPSQGRVVFKARNYGELIDCPILISDPDTSGFNIANTRININCANEAGVPIAGYLTRHIEKQFQTVHDFIGDPLPVNEYNYLINLADYADFSDFVYNKPLSMEVFGQMVQKHGPPIVGALEHNTSSYHHYIYLGKPESVIDLLDVSVIHEFLHILVPLQLHADVTANFDYNQATITQHLWLYEGVTEYFSGLVNLHGGQINLPDYLTDVIRQKMIRGQAFPGGLAWTDVSRNIYESPYKEQFMQFYMLGAVNAMMLDIEIIDLTDGQKSLKSVLFEMIERYGRDKGFAEDQLFSELTDLVHPELMHFFKYFTDTINIDYKSQLNKIGIGFEVVHEGRIPKTILEKAYGVEDVIEAFRLYTINEVKPGSVFQPGDKIRSATMNDNCLTPFMKADGLFVNEMDTVSIPVFRNKEWINVHFVPEWKNGKYYFRIWKMDGLTDRQQRNFKVWRSGVPVS